MTGTDGPLDGDAYTTWVGRLLPSQRRLVLVLVPALLAGSVFALGYGVSRLGSDRYLVELYPYVGGGGVFWTVLWLGWVDSVLVDAWNRVRPAFDVDDDTFRRRVGSGLARFCDDRVTLGYSVALLLPYVALVALFYLPAFGGVDVVGMVVQPEVRARLGGYSLARVANYVLFGLVLVPALVTSVRGFLNHVALLREVRRMPFRNAHTAARQLEPLAKFSMTPATAWFAGISLVLLWMRAGVRDSLALLLVATLVLVGVLHIAAPLLLLHDALQRARQELLTEIRHEYEEIRRSVRAGDEPPDRLSLWLEVTDRRRRNANSVSTWVYDVPSLSRLAAASVIPWLTLVEQVLPLLPSL
jgi:hypothetical protein